MVDVLRDGYVIPFVSLPPLANTPISFESYSTNSLKWQKLDQEIQDMIGKEALEEATSDPGFYSRMFIIERPDKKKWRPVIDLSPLNKFIQQTPFQMETNVSVLRAIRQDDWMISIDLKDAYFQIPIHPQSRKYLRFVWGSKTFQFKVICFGLSTAPQIFTRIMAPVSYILHTRGVRMLRYLEDWLLLSATREQSIAARDEALNLCQHLGLLINLEKLNVLPSQTTSYLGMEINSSILRAFPTEKRKEALRNVISQFLKASQAPAILWLQLLGHMSSLCLLVPGGRRRMRNLQFQLYKHWYRTLMDDSHQIPISQDIRVDLHWWTQDQHLMKGCSLAQRSPDLLLFSDASIEGW